MRQNEYSTKREERQEGARSPGDSCSFWLRWLAIAGVEDHRRLRRRCRLTVLPGGVVARAYQGDNRRAVGGGPRGPICGFSGASRKRLRVILMGVDWSPVQGSWLALTYHDEWGGSWRDWKADLRRFLARFDYRFPLCRAVVWRLEFQARGAPHYHLLILWPRGHRPPAGALHSWCRHNWNHCLGQEHDSLHGRHGAHLVDVHTDEGLGRLLGYLTKELCRVDQDVVGRPTGRVWGVRGDLPLSDGLIVDLTEGEWLEFIERVHLLPGAAHSWYLRAVNENWAGFVVLSGGDELEELIQGLGTRTVGQGIAAPAAQASLGQKLDMQPGLML